MKTYFVTSDIHSYYAIFRNELDKQGFDINNQDHILILCGDAFDRGSQAKKLLNFLIKLKKLNRLVYIKGNHEYLLEDCLMQLQQGFPISHHHWTNGTVDTIAQLTNNNKYDLISGVYNFNQIWKELSDYHDLIWDAYNYYELGDYIFVHGWIPHIRKYKSLKECAQEEWEKATWSNGMSEWHNKWRLKHKTIVCGHWHTSFGNYKYHRQGSGEFEKDSNFGVFKDKGIIALDACTTFSKQCNIIKIEI